MGDSYPVEGPRSRNLVDGSFSISGDPGKGKLVSSGAERGLAEVALGRGGDCL
jgi:hypothetical protein